MAAGAIAPGRILTFYSYKGGVGRTMALANTAFLAATNGLRVLVMDWDLEAPGLAYYFRGMQEGAAARALRTAPGVLDLLWDWARSVRAATSIDEVQGLSERFSSGTPFEAAVRPVLSDGDLNGGRLDLMGAGAPVVAAPGPLPYEEALSLFEWNAFFDEEAGGSMLTILTDWARRNYDYVFVDSRTGFADVAGICTMQVPDVVVLCFIYNRQNMDGIAQVSGAVRGRRGEAIQVRPAPMRVARENTPEEADARAHARKVLTRQGKLAADDVDRGLRYLAVRAAANVPFHETVAMVVADRPETDPLSLNYLAFANELLGLKLEMPDLDEQWVQAVVRRLSPRQATADYVLKLRSSDPDRAREEVSHLVQAAADAGGAAEDEREYLEALIQLAIQLARGAGPVEAVTMCTSTLDLARVLAEADGSWQPMLIDVIDGYLEIAGGLTGPDEEILLLDEADALLAGQDLPGARSRRIVNRRRTARLQVDVGLVDAARQSVSELTRLVSEAASDPAWSETEVDVAMAEVDIRLLSGDMASVTDAAEQARDEYREALALLDRLQDQARPDVMRFRFDLHGRLARLDPEVIGADAAAWHAIEAVRFKGVTSTFATQFLSLANVVNRAGDLDGVSRFILFAFAPGERSRAQLMPYLARGSSRLGAFLDYVVGAFDLLASSGDRYRIEASELLDVALEVIQRSQHPVVRPSRTALIDMRPSVRRLEESVAKAGDLFPPDGIDRVRALYLKPDTPGRSVRPRDGEP